MTKAGFHNDRERDYQFSLQGWMILRIPAGLILKDLPSAMERVERFIAAQDKRDRASKRQNSAPSPFAA